MTRPSSLLGPPVLTVAAFGLLIAVTRTPAGEAAESLLALMPRVEDYTHMWWAEGFPSHTPSAPWRRVVQTGHYAMALDTDTMRIPRLGTTHTGLGYADCARCDNAAWQRLPPAELTLTITANGKKYRCTAGGKWSQFRGPRLIESGRFVQRADVTDLVFSANDGARLNVEARFETVAWPARLGMVLAARPGQVPIPAGETCFGRVGGGFGLSGTNHLDVPHSPELDPGQFTLELWVYVPSDYQVSKRSSPWLVCKNVHEEVEGNYGIVIRQGRPQARMNIGGGRRNMFAADSRHSLKVEAWNHIAMSYDGNVLRLFMDGRPSGECRIGRKRTPGRQGLTFGRRQDNWRDGHRLRGVVDEIRFYDRALTSAEVRKRFSKPVTAIATLKPVREWCFRADGHASSSRPREQWKDASMDILLKAAEGERHARYQTPGGRAWGTPDWREVSVAWHPASPRPAERDGPLKVLALELPGEAERPVYYDPARGWYRVNLDGIVPTVPPGKGERRNDSIERVKLVLSNPSDTPRVARLLFEKTQNGIRQHYGEPITGMSVVLRDADGHPTGIPVQLSKNWHTSFEGGVHAGIWFHGFSLVHLPPRAAVELELALVYGHWGGLAAASHTQLCLIGWGSNQLWDESALGSWGESICYEPDRCQAGCAVLDVRPVMVHAMNNGFRWRWTHNVGGGDFFLFLDPGGKRVFPKRMRTAYHSQGPCLTEVTYAGLIGEGIEHSATVSLSRTDDVVRGTYRLRMDVKKPADLSRFVVFQIGSDTYSYTGERRMALGNENGLLREWATQWGGNTYRTEPMECTERIPWVSLHEAVPRKAKGAWANRGVVIRSWQARLGGRKAAPWLAEHGVRARGNDTSTVDIVPPPGVARLEIGDFVEATFEHIVMPRFAADYYGPNEALRTALGQSQNTWRMIHREAVVNDRRVEIRTGTLETLYPAIRVEAAKGRAEFTLSGGLGYVPITFSGLLSPRGRALVLDGQRLDQSTHGNDFWQTDYDAATKRWSLTFNVPASDGVTPTDEHLDRGLRVVALGGPPE